MSNEKAYKQLPLLHLQGLYGNIHINYIISSETANFFKVQNKICMRMTKNIMIQRVFARIHD